MKKNIASLLACFLLLNIGVGCKQENKSLKPEVKVDERTELMSIVFRLANAGEYMNNFIEDYTQDIDAYFEPYKEHELIKWLPEQREEYGIGYDAVMAYAVHLKIKDNQIIFDPNLEKGLDERWQEEIANEFLEKLNDFYQVTKFNHFFKKHTPLFTSAQQNFNEILEEVNFNWFKNYYGEIPKGKYHVILSIANGGHNYGPNITYKDGKEDIYAIMGVWKKDSIGYPAYDQSAINIVIHEFNHSFCNPLIDEYYTQMADKAKELYEANSEQFKRQAYGLPKTILYETLVRASVIQYLKSTGKAEEDIAKEILKEQKKGFAWIDKLCDKLSEYEQKKEIYPTLRSFMPEIVELVNELSVE